MKLIPLSQGKFAKVDNRDFARISSVSWYALNNKGVFYACRHEWDGKKRRLVLMHHEVLGVPSRTKMDHKDRDGLNNLRKNLRIATASQNGGNRKKQDGTSSEFKGVSWHKKNRRWDARIMLHKRPIILGSFRDEKKAAAAYNSAALKFFGEFARINTIS